MTPEQKATAHKWIQKHWSAGDCPLHGPTTWALNSVILAVPAWRSSTISPNVSLPVVSLNCATCGYLVFFSAILMGVVPADERSNEPSEQPEAQ